eukprot:6336747-Pyramimonas_sp.AAC.1
MRSRTRRQRRGLLVYTDNDVLRPKGPTTQNMTTNDRNDDDSITDRRLDPRDATLVADISAGDGDNEE